MSQTALNSDIKRLFIETEIRYPAQKFEPETKQAYMHDWKERASEVGFARFQEGVRRARGHCKFFPLIADINSMIPDSVGVDWREAAWQAEFNDLVRRRRAGEKFYSLADVFKEFSRRVEAGEFKSADPEKQKSLEAWAKKLKHSEKAAHIFLAEEKKRNKSDFKPVAETIS